MFFFLVNELSCFQQLHGHTTGWIGMGISPNGGMTGADIVVGWVKNSIPEVTVRKRPI